MKNTFLYLAVVGALFLASCGTVTQETGNDYKIVDLPDGSIIYMNESTSISYPEDFMKNRTVHLKGEAYFDVMKNETPFVIKTSQGSILITGTKLNVNANENNKELDVEVDEGVVEVTANKVKKVVNRGEKAVYKAVNKDIKIEKAEFKFRIWMGKLETTLGKVEKNVEKGINKGSKSVKKGLDKTEKKLDKMIK